MEGLGLGVISLIMIILWTSYINPIDGLSLVWTVVLTTICTVIIWFLIFLFDDDCGCNIY